MPKNLDTLPHWKTLNDLKATSEPSTYKCYLKNAYFDLTLRHHELNQHVFRQLMQLPQAQGLELARQEWANGCFNEECTPNYHFLRRFENIPENYHDELENTRKKMRCMVDAIREGEWRGATGKPITDVVNIGMGGSDLGPRLSLEVLAEFKNTNLRFHFISDADPYAFAKVLEGLTPETTLFLVSSKSFSTEETLLNAQYASAWVAHPDALKHHFIALTAQPERAQKLGYEHMLTISDWVIGRYSSCSSMNLILALMIGYDSFIDFLKGAQDMDAHFFNTPVEENMPMLMALLGIWNINFLNIPSHLLLMYDSRIRYFVDYVQQMDMESNGKSVNRHDEPINYATAPIIWGGLGNQAHHSYYQLLAQGTHRIGIDFMTVEENEYELINALCRSRIEILQEGIPSLVPHEKIMPQVSTHHLHLHQLNPQTLGALISLYENKVFTQAWLWNLNPFDQPGVESAKAHAQFSNPFRG